MDAKFSTLDLTPRVRPTGYRVAVVVLGLGLVAAVGGHLQAIDEMRREIAAEAGKTRSCEEKRVALGAEVQTLRAAAGARQETEAGPSNPLAAPAGREGDTRDSSGTASPPSQEDVKSLIGTGQHKLQACYRRALRHDPDLGMRSLRLRLSFTLRSSGEVRGVAFSPAPARDLRSCLRDVVGRWKVKPFGGESIAVEVPITLAPQS